jgi:cephalosporin hydroxylase
MLLEPFITRLHNDTSKNQEAFQRLILDLGLNDEHLEEQPVELAPYFGKGLKLWQYPHQLAAFAQKISELTIDSYLEIGCRFGGTFIFLSELLAKRNPNLRAYACNIIQESDFLQQYHLFRAFSYIQLFSQEPLFIDMCRWLKPMFVFIDGDHSYEGVQNDFLIFSQMPETKYIAFHDIVSDVCPGVVKIWQEMKQDDRFETFEFIEQYESVKGNFLGIGLAVRK